jgi:hypothetical protein
MIEETFIRHIVLFDIYQVAPNLPKPPPIPMFMPAQPIPVPEPDKKPTPKSSPRASPRSSPVPPKTDDKSKAKSETVDKGMYLYLSLLQ